MEETNTWTYPGSGRKMSSTPQQSVLLELADILKEESKATQSLAAIPEWSTFSDGRLQTRADFLAAPLGGRDPRMKDFNIFDQFESLKPVPKEVFKK